MKVWITRPESGEIYMGGYRSVEVWLEKPAYSHRPHPGHGRIPGNDNEIIFYDEGWTAESVSGVIAKRWLKQDKLLFDNVWKEIVLSTGPKGMLYEEVVQWFDTPANAHLRNNYSQLVNDVNWEAKCNTCHKRFLLEVDVRAQTIERIIPNVYHRVWTDPGQPLYPEFEKTDQISDFLALERQHLPSDYHIPF